MIQRGRTAATADGGAASARSEHLWLTLVRWLAILTPMLYSLWRVLWAAGFAIGISPEGLDEVRETARDTLSLIVLALPAAATGAFVYLFLGPDRRTAPGWIPEIGRALIRPRWVIGILLIPIVILVYANVLNAIVLVTSLEPSEQTADLPVWSRWAHAVVFLVWGVSLAVAVAAYYLQTRESSDPNT